MFVPFNKNIDIWAVNTVHEALRLYSEQFFGCVRKIISSFDESPTKLRNTLMWTLHDVEEARAWQFQVPRALSYVLSKWVHGL